MSTRAIWAPLNTKYVWTTLRWTFKSFNLGTWIATELHLNASQEFLKFYIKERSRTQQNVKYMFSKFFFQSTKSSKSLKRVQSNEQKRTKENLPLRSSSYSDDALDIFKASALWADAFYKLKCPCVCLSVCLSVTLSHSV